MSVLVFIEVGEGKIRKTSLEAVAYANALKAGEVVAVALGSIEAAELASVGKYGATKVLHVYEGDA